MNFSPDRRLWDVFFEKTFLSCAWATSEWEAIEKVVGREAYNGIGEKDYRYDARISVNVLRMEVEQVTSYEEVAKLTQEIVSKAKRGQGRKPIKQGETTITMSIRLTVCQRMKLERLGGAAWIRERIEESK